MKIMVFLSNRATYERSKNFLYLLQRKHDLTIVVTSDLLSPRCKNIIDELVNDSYRLVKIPLEEYTGDFKTMAKSSFKLGLVICDVIDHLKPELGIVIGDRFELLPFAQAFAYNYIRLIHVQAGEKSGNIDNKVRHAVSSLSDVLMCPSDEAKKLTEDFYGASKDILNTGCLSIDEARPFLVGHRERHIICIFHPHTDEYEEIENQTKKLYDDVLKFCQDRNYVCHWFVCNNDPGFNKIRDFLYSQKGVINPIENLSGREFLALLATSTLIVGNSSAGIKESSYLRIPSILVGDRQKGRIVDRNVIRCSFKQSIYLKMVEALGKNKYCVKEVFGKGFAAQRIMKHIHNKGVHSGSEIKRKKEKRGDLQDQPHSISPGASEAI